MHAEIITRYTPGCIGRIAELHAAYYARHAGFGLAFEAKVARELAGFRERLDGTRDGLWLVTQDGRVEGSIAIDGLRGADAAGAHLRWFIVSDALRGQGAGRALLQRATDFVDARG
jgi:GNAT superfamily N-acetyltransferase